MIDNSHLAGIDWLATHLEEPDITVVDASWYLPTMLSGDGRPRNGKREYGAQHIPGAVFFDIDEITQPESALPHTLAPEEIFSRKVGTLGISDQDTIIIYDGLGLFSAARVWWNFKVMGVENVAVLDGGFPAWQAAGLPVESGIPAVSPKVFNAQFDVSSTVGFNAMKNIVSNADTQVMDARPAGRFSGEEAEPRAGMRSGHMPGATSIPFSTLLDNGKLLPADKLRDVFNRAGIDLDQPIVTTCGSGVTAAALTLALETIGHRDHALYDGSWAEWGGRDDTDVSIGSSQPLKDTNT